MGTSAPTETVPATVPDMIHKIPRHSLLKGPTPRLSLEHIGKILGTNSKGRLPSEMQDVVFIAIDCEAYEFDQRKTTEIGVSILDTTLIDTATPGSNAIAWFNKSRSEHFRIKEFRHLVNKRWVKGDPESFSFGSSTWISKFEAKGVLNDIFDPPGSGANRDIVLVGHGVKNEVAYLQNLNFDLMEAPNVVGILDTQSIATGKSQIGLKKLCDVVGLEPQSLHNAGNDAAYTLRAMILATILRDSTPGAFEAAFQSQRKIKSEVSKQPEPALDAISQEKARLKMKAHQERKAKWLQRQSSATAGSTSTYSTIRLPLHQKSLDQG